MNDKLDDKTDAELNELFAVEVAGWRSLVPTCEDGWIGVSPTPTREGYAEDVPRFCTDANAVLPWLERAKAWGWWIEIKDHTNGIECGVRDWLVIVTNFNPSDDAPLPTPNLYREGVAPTFARAAVIALLRAKRAPTAPPTAAPRQLPLAPSGLARTG